VEWSGVSWLVNESVKEVLRFSRELLLLEAGSLGRGQFRNLDEGECPPLEAVTRRLMKMQQAEET
jgi:hypothetical protein